YASFAQLAAGHLRECATHIDELLRLDPVRVRVSHPINPVLDLAWVMTALGRADEFLESATTAEVSTRWLEAGTAFARGEVELAADICAEIGVGPNEAYTRLRAA